MKDEDDPIKEEVLESNIDDEEVLEDEDDEPSFDFGDDDSDFLGGLNSENASDIY